MIDTTKEHLFPAKELPKRVQKRTGKKISLATGYRWFQIGIAGVPLERVYIGAEAYCSEEAVGRFFENVTRAKTGDSPKQTKASLANSERIDRELQEAGI